VLPAKQKLAVQVGDVDGVQVDHLDVFEPAQHERLEELAPDAASADHQNCGFGGSVDKGGVSAARGRFYAVRRAKSDRSDLRGESKAGRVWVVVGGNAAEHDSPRREIERDVLFASFASCASLDGDIMTPGAPARADRSGHPAISPRLFLPRAPTNRDIFTKQ
jgi:hypothetical protein